MHSLNSIRGKKVDGWQAQDNASGMTDSIGCRVHGKKQSR